MKKKLTEKQAKVVDRMQEVRIQDTVNLRDKANNKLAWVLNEKDKGLKLIEAHQVEIEKLKAFLVKLEGAESALRDLLKE